MCFVPISSLRVDYVILRVICIFRYSSRWKLGKNEIPIDLTSPGIVRIDFEFILCYSLYSKSKKEKIKLGDIAIQQKTNYIPFS